MESIIRCRVRGAGQNVYAEGADEQPQLTMSLFSGHLYQEIHQNTVPAKPTHPLQRMPPPASVLTPSTSRQA